MVTPTVMIIIFLALLQAIAGVAWATAWFKAGAATMDRGVVLLPLLGALLYVVGALATIVPILYVVFAWAAFSGRPSAWTIGMVATALNLIGVLIFALAGAPLSETLMRGVGAVVILAYLMTPVTRRTLGARPL